MGVARSLVDLLDFKSLSEREPAMKRVLRDLIGGTPETMAEEYKKRSAVFWPEKINVPLMIIHGTDDWRVDVSHSEILAEKLSQLNKEFELVLYEGDDHGISNNFEDALEKILLWFESHLTR